MEALVALGSNVAAEANVPKALRHLEGLAPVQARSQAWRTPAHGPVEGGAFLNVVVHVAWHADLDALQHALKRVERALGRAPATTWNARSIDLDIVAVREPPRKGWTVLDPALGDKPFLLRPLAEVAPRLSLGNRTVADLASALAPQDAVLVELRTR